MTFSCMPCYEDSLLDLEEGDMAAHIRDVEPHFRLPDGTIT